MPKLKTKRAAVKRMRSTASGKIKAGKAGARHNLGNKQRDTKRRLRGSFILSHVDEKHAKKALPYGLPK